QGGALGGQGLADAAEEATHRLGNRGPRRVGEDGRAVARGRQAAGRGGEEGIQNHGKGSVALGVSAGEEISAARGEKQRVGRESHRFICAREARSKGACAESGR